MITGIRLRGCMQRRSQRAFTIVELLISIAVIAIILSVALMALGQATRTAKRLATYNALRQMMVAYTGYSAEHKGQLLPGYVDPDKIGTLPDQLDLKAFLPSGKRLNAADTASYVWRLAPYLDNAWQTYMSDYQDSSLAAGFEHEYKNDAYGPGTYDGVSELGIGLATSFGLNSLFVGGDNYHGPTSVWSPWRNWPRPYLQTCAATHIRDVKRPSTLIVFGSSKRANSDAEPRMATQPNTSQELGYIQLHCPFAIDLSGDCVFSWWIATSGPEVGKIHIDFVHAGGIPIDRTGRDQVPVASMDCSVRSESLYALWKNPNLWSAYTLDVPVTTP